MLCADASRSFSSMQSSMASSAASRSPVSRMAFASSTSIRLVTGRPPVMASRMARRASISARSLADSARLVHGSSTDGAGCASPSPMRNHHRRVLSASTRAVMRTGDPAATPAGSGTLTVPASR